ncbi:halocyanin [Halovenus sp. WSH3]|uniref:Halocyanin n=1 Tax=Halovenus carboxidivorans TaxID=2692199 RepID=A0A6B0T9I0_9EURY|nr:plastocyanin/azurin family copper-binding protein [Halovenus carboxidivorans]MXR52223.1 halocyanin [Halovenus carboxidivorans]
MNRRAFLGLVGAGASATLAGCFDGQAAATDDNRVTMTQVDFRPEELRVPVGTTVVFENTSSHSHTVTASGLPEAADDSEYFASGGFDSYEAAKAAWDDRAGGILEPGDTFENEFTTPGRYDYVCIPHLRQDMVGAIIVEEAETSDDNSTASY